MVKATLDGYELESNKPVEVDKHFNKKRLLKPITARFPEAELVQKEGSFTVPSDILVSLAVKRDRIPTKYRVRCFIMGIGEDDVPIFAPSSQDLRLSLQFHTRKQFQNFVLTAVQICDSPQELNVHTRSSIKYSSIAAVA